MLLWWNDYVHLSTNKKITQHKQASFQNQTLIYLCEGLSVLTSKGCAILSGNKVKFSKIKTTNFPFTRERITWELWKSQNLQHDINTSMQKNDISIRNKVEEKSNLSAQFSFVKIKKTKVVVGGSL